MRVTETTCKTALSKSSLPGLACALNPYRGCEHRCAYCYAPSVLREEREWGTFLDVKVNIPVVLFKELKKMKKRGKAERPVGISTVTDPYQPAEKRSELTRRCLELLLSHDFPISVQTKSVLCLRDIDLLKRFTNAEVGFTITAMDDDVRKRYEPVSSSTEEKFSALQELKSKGLRTWVFLGPILPYITDMDMEKIISFAEKAKIDYMLVDRLNLKPGVWGKVKTFLEGYEPSLVQKYETVFFGKSDYYDCIFKEIERLCGVHEIKWRKAF